MFGQGATTNTFGQPTAFGAATPAPFGTMNPQPQQSTLFGQTSAPSMFGMSQPNSIFGASNTSQASSFGAQQPTSTFGNTSLFGNANRGFGMTPGTTFSNTLGSSISAQPGTTVKFSPQVGTDTMMKNGHSQSTSINIRLQCITCMPVYESKSLEELRFEDYQANRKGGVAQLNTSLFGSSTLNTGLNTALNTGLSTGLSTGSNLFENPSSTNATFGSSASTNNLFGQNKSTFGTIAPTTTTTSFFGSSNLNANKSASLFGQNAPTNTFGQPNAFGATSTPAPFGTHNTQPQQGSLFTQPSASLFGNKSQSNTIFGATNNNPTNTFGSIAPTTTTTSFFGSSNLNANKPTSLFGQNAPTNTFGQPNAFGNTNTFGALNPQPQQKTSIFGQTSTNSMFGMSQPSSLFGATNNNQTNTFGSLAPSTSTTNFFGSNLNASKPTLFSNPTTNTFGQLNAFGSTTSAPFGSLNIQPQQGSLFGQSSPSTLFATNQQGPIDSSSILTRLQTFPYGSSQLLVDSSSSPGVKTKFTTDTKILNQYKINAKAQVEMKVQRVPTARKPSTLLFDGLDDESAENLKCAQDIFSPRPNIKKLVLRKKSLNSPNFNSQSDSKIQTDPEIHTQFSPEQNATPFTSKHNEEHKEKPVCQKLFQANNL